MSGMLRLPRLPVSRSHMGIYDPAADAHAQQREARRAFGDEGLRGLGFMGLWLRH